MCRTRLVSPEQPVLGIAIRLMNTTVLTNVGLAKRSDTSLTAVPQLFDWPTANASIQGSTDATMLCRQLWRHSASTSMSSGTVCLWQRT